MPHTSQGPLTKNEHKDGSSESNVDGSASRNPLTMQGVQPFNNADASLIPSALPSPTHSCVELNYNNAVFSRNTSFNGGARNGRSAQASVAGSVTSHDGLQHASEHGDGDGHDDVSATPTVKVNLTPAIIGYFGWTFGNGINAFFSLMFREKGFGSVAIGVLAAFNPMLCMTLLPVLSYLTDKFRCETQMVLACSAIATTSAFAFTIARRQYFVVLYFLIMTASRIVMNPLLDQRTLMMFPREGRSSAWSYVRSYGAYGWGIGSLAASILSSWTGTWVSLAAQYLAGQLCLSYCMLVVKPYEKITKVPVRFKEVLHLLASNKRVMLFLFASTMMGTGYSFIDNFLFLFLDELGGPTVLMGFTVVLTVSTEIPLFQMSERMHRIFTERNMMTISMSVWTFRVVCYSLLRNPWWVLLIEPLHGVTFAFMWLPSMHLIARAFPPKLSSSATGVLFTLTSGVGPMIGNLVAGTLYKVAGPRVMFRCAASVMLLSLLFYLTADYVLERRGVPIVCDYDAADTAAATDVAVTADECGKQGDPDSDEPRKVDKVSRSAQENEGVHGGRQSALDVVDGELPE